MATAGFTVTVTAPADSVSMGFNVTATPPNISGVSVPFPFTIIVNDPPAVKLVVGGVLTQSRIGIDIGGTLVPLTN